MPVISFEAVCGQSPPNPGTRTRIVIFVALSSQIPGGYFGVITQGFPQLVRVNADVVKHDPSRNFPERGPILCQVRMLNESPLIPDFECLEQMISGRDPGSVGRASARQSTRVGLKPDLLQIPPQRLQHRQRDHRRCLGSEHARARGAPA